MTVERLPINDRIGERDQAVLEALRLELGGPSVLPDLVLDGGNVELG
jgi:hypothetical protein